MIIKIAKLIKAETAKKKHIVSTYFSLKKDTNLNENSSKPLSFLLFQISPKLKYSLVALLIKDMATSVAENTFSTLQLSLALLVNNKRVIKTLHKFGITPR